MRGAAWVVVALTLGATSAAGQLNGPAFRVNASTAGNSGAPAVAVSPAGFSVTWASASGVSAQRYTSAGLPSGGNFTVATPGNVFPSRHGACADASGNLNVGFEDADGGVEVNRYNAAGQFVGSTLVPTQYYEVYGRINAGCAPGGAFVVSWTHYLYGSSVVAQRFSNTGARLGDPIFFVANGPALNPDVATDANGDFVVVWQEVGPIWAQRRAANGSALSAAFRVDQGQPTDADNGEPRVAMDPKGSFLVVWPDSANNALVRHYDASGIPTGNPYRANASASNGAPDVAAGGDGDFVVVWSGSGGVKARYIAPAGTPNGEEITVSPTGSAPAVESDSLGRHVVAWTDADGDFGGVFARRLVSPQQPLSDELRVNAQTTGLQERSSVAVGADGGFLVVWKHDSGSGSDILAQRYSAAAAPIGGEFRVNGYTTGNQDAPRIVAQPNGYVVAWYGAGADGTSVYARRLDATGAALSAEFRVNTDTLAGGTPTLAAAANGDFIVAWHGAPPPVVGGLDVYARRYTAAGVPLGTDFRVNSSTTSDQQTPAVVMGPQGDFVITWRDASSDAGDIMAKRYSSAGAVVGGEFRINASTTGLQASPSIARDSQGKFVVAWDTDSLDGNSKGIAARRFAADWTPLTNDVVVNTFTTGDQETPVAAFDAAGGFTIAWSSNGEDGSGRGIYARRFTKTGEPFGDGFRVSTYTTNDQSSPALAIGRTMVVTWTSNLEDGSNTGVYAQPYKAPCRPSDANGDTKLDVADVFYLINKLFAAGPAAMCTCDANADGVENVADVFYLINYLFAGGAPPA